MGLEPDPAHRTEGQRRADRQTDRQPRAGGSLAGDGDRSCPGAVQPPRRVRAHQLSPCGQKTKETAPKPGGGARSAPRGCPAGRPRCGRDLGEAGCQRGGGAGGGLPCCGSGRQEVLSVLRCLDKHETAPRVQPRGGPGGDSPCAGRPLPRVQRRALQPLPAPRGFPARGSAGKRRRLS